MLVHREPPEPTGSFSKGHSSFAGSVSLDA
jgi:hypothetical protein